MLAVLLAQDRPIVAPGAKLERLFGEGFFTEGPAPAPDGSVYFSDITVGKASGYQAGYIWRWDPQTRTSTVFRSPSDWSWRRAPGSGAGGSRGPT